MLTHAQLVALAAKWLGRANPLVVTEMATGIETPDALGFKGQATTLVECKASRSDFLTDAQKPFRQSPQLGMGGYRYYLCETGVITEEDLPPQWGLLWVDGRRIRTVVKSDWRTDHNAKAEVALLVSALRRCVTASTVGVSVKCYTIKTKSTATLGVEPEELVDTAAEPATICVESATINSESRNEI